MNAGSQPRVTATGLSRVLPCPAMLRRSRTSSLADPPRSPRSTRSERSARTPRAAREGAAATPALIDDAAHAAAFADHQHKEWYTEWWYFNVRDPRTGIALLASYEATPFGLGTGAFAAVVYPPGDTPIDATDVYGPSDVSASSTRPDVRIGPNHLEAIDDDTYRLVAASRDGRIAWDLTLTRVPGAPPAWQFIYPRGTTVVRAGSSPQRLFTIPADPQLLALARKVVPGVALSACAQTGAQRQCLPHAPGNTENCNPLRRH